MPCDFISISAKGDNIKLVNSGLFNLEYKNRLGNNSSQDEFYLRPLKSKGDYRKQFITIHQTCTWIKGSIHKFSHNGVNYTDFSIKDLKKAISIYCDTFKINPETSRVKSIEWGVNFLSPFSATIENLRCRFISHRGVAFQDMRDIKKRQVIGIVCHHTDYSLKIYSKTTQYQLPYELVRVELKVHRMQAIQSYTKKKTMFLSDLTLKETSKYFNKRLMDELSQIVIIDESIIDLNKSDSTFYSKVANPLVWNKNNSKLKPHTRLQWRKRLNRILNNSKGNLRTVFLNLVESKLQLLTTECNEFTPKNSTIEKDPINNEFTSINVIDKNVTLVDFYISELRSRTSIEFKHGD